MIEIVTEQHEELRQELISLLASDSSDLTVKWLTRFTDESAANDDSGTQSFMPDFAFFSTLLTRLQLSDPVSVKSATAQAFPCFGLPFSMVSNDILQLSLLLHDNLPKKIRTKYSSAAVMLVLQQSLSSANSSAQITDPLSQQITLALLQNFTRQLIEATSGDIGAHEAGSMILQAAQKITATDELLAVSYPLEQGIAPTIISSLPESASAEIAYRTVEMMINQDDIAKDGLLADLFADLPASLINIHYHADHIPGPSDTSAMLVSFQLNAFSKSQAELLSIIAEQLGLVLASRRQADFQNRMLIELARYTYINEVISGSIDAKLIISTISNAASQALLAPIAICGWLAEDGTINIIPETTCGIKSDLAKKLHLNSKNSVIRRVIEQGNSVTSAESGVKNGNIFPALREVGIASWVCIPMKVKSVVRGILLVADIKERIFYPRDLAMLSIYATQAALALRNSQLVEQVSQQLEHINRLYAITRAISVSLNRQEILDALTSEVAQSFQAAAVLVSMRDGDSTQQHLVATHGVAEEFRSVIIPATEGIFGTVLQRQEYIISQHPASDGRSQLLRNIAREEKLSSSLTVAMHIQQLTIGTITIFSHNERQYYPDQIQLLQTIATEVAIALQHAKLLEQEKARTDLLGKMVKTVANRIVNSLHLLEDLQAADDNNTTAAVNSLLQARISALTAIEEIGQKSSSSQVDINEALKLWLQQQRTSSYSLAGALPITISGARLFLPMSHATPMMLLISEWLQQAFTAYPPSSSQTIKLTIQQLGRENLLQLIFPVTADYSRKDKKSAIITLLSELVPGTVTEILENDTCQLRYRFSTAQWEI